MSSVHWFVLESGCSQADENMAIDEALLESVQQLGAAVLRFYGWTEPAATFGYSQRYGDVVNWTELRPLIRRPTGGGLVLHDSDWTYSLVFPPSHEWYRLPAQESYCRVHRWIHAAFASIGLETVLADSARKDFPGQCFVGAEKFDLISAGKKIAGAAQRRNRHGLLIQGSVRPGRSGLSRAAWEAAMQQTCAIPGDIRWSDLNPGTELRRRVRILATEKYSQTQYNQRR
jgi:lipoyl(octanoyl) transferase